MKYLFLPLLLVLTVAAASAQKSANRFVARFGDGRQLDMTQSGALMKPDSSLSVIAVSRGNETHSFQIKLSPTNTQGSKRFSRAYYYFSGKDQRLNYTPGQSLQYTLQIVYLLEGAGSKTQVWETGSGPDKGFIEIESITDTRVKGRFSCELLQTSPARGPRQTLEGSFDVAIRPAGTPQH